MEPERAILGDFPPVAAETRPFGAAPDPDNLPGMWRTPSGDRKLAGAERRLFLSGAVALEELLRGAVQAGDDVPVGVGPFDNLETERRRWLLIQVAVALGGDGPAPDLNAYSESAVMAVFTAVRINMGAEVGITSGTPDEQNRWRRLAREAWMERCSDNTKLHHRDEGYRQSESSANITEWHDKIEDLADLILWDRDFEMEESLVDRPPGAARATRNALGIDTGYFRSVPDMPGEKEQRELMRAFDLYKAEVEERL